jgi:mono/diheme cytochrome c family protein
MAAGPVWSEEDGAKHGLYRRHCAHCHGVTGDGRGPTAMFLNPYPRDYRPGKFKFKSTLTAAKPTDDDLRRILVGGINSTSMPSFKLLPDDEIDALVEYVKYLSIRGEVETRLAQFAADELFDDDDNPVGFDFSDGELDLATIVKDEIAAVVDTWAEATEQVIRPDIDAVPPTERSEEEHLASIEAGRTLFFGKADCVKCHGPTGLGDGQTDDWNDWNKAVKQFVERTDDVATSLAKSEATGEELEAQRQQVAMREAVAATLFPVRKIQPRNLRDGIYRGGRRPLDLFWRVHSGINGTPMPANGTNLTQEEIWQVVAYIRSLPFEPASRPQQPLPVLARERL